MVQAYFDEMLQSLIVSPGVSYFRVLRQEIADDEGFVRIRCVLSDNSMLEFAEYVNLFKKRVNIETYSYHWQKADGRLIKRWDNVPHHKEVKTFPHHLHLSDNSVVKSSRVTLNMVLSEIERALIVDDE